MRKPTPCNIIKFPATRCWVIRSQRPKRKDAFHIIGNQWTFAPSNATIYPREEDAMLFIATNRKRGRKKGLFNDGEILEAVPLEGALETCNLKPIRLTRE